MNIDLTDLEDKAILAGGGLWSSGIAYGGSGYSVRSADGKQHIANIPRSYGQPKSKAEFIAAANPAAILELIAQLRAAREFLPILNGLVADIQGLMSESHGVAGLHLNGDVAPWGELEPGGRFERLGSLQAAIEIINKVEA